MFLGVEDALKRAMLVSTQGRPAKKGLGLVPPSLGLTTATSLDASRAVALSLDPTAGLATATARAAAPLPTKAAPKQKGARRGRLVPQIDAKPEESPVNNERRATLGTLERLMSQLDGQYGADPSYNEAREKIKYRLQGIVSATDRTNAQRSRGQGSRGKGGPGPAKEPLPPLVKRDAVEVAEDLAFPSYDGKGKPTQKGAKRIAANVKAHEAGMDKAAKARVDAEFTEAGRRRALEDLHPGGGAALIAPWYAAIDASREFGEKGQKLVPEVSPDAPGPLRMLHNIASGLVSAANFPGALGGAADMMDAFEGYVQAVNDGDAKKADEIREAAVGRDGWDIAGNLLGMIGGGKMMHVASGAIGKRFGGRRLPAPVEGIGDVVGEKPGMRPVSDGPTSAPPTVEVPEPAPTRRKGGLQRPGPKPGESQPLAPIPAVEDLPPAPRPGELIPVYESRAASGYDAQGNPTQTSRPRPRPQSAAEQSAAEQTAAANARNASQAAPVEPLPDPLATPRAEPATPAAMPVEGGTAVRSAVVDAERTARGLEPVERQDFTTLGEAEERGRAAVEAGRDHRALATEVATKKRPLSAEEVGVLYEGRRRLLSESNEAGRRLDDAIAKGESTDELRAAYERARADLDANDQALVIGGREQSAAFVARQMGGKVDLGDPEAAKLEARRAKGAALTPDEEATVGNLATQLAEKDRALADAQGKGRELAAATAVAQEAAAVETMRKRVRRPDREGQKARIALDRERLKVEMVDLSTQFAKGFSSAGAGVVLTPEQVRVLGRMAKNAVHQGALTLEEVVAKVREHLGDAGDDLEDRQIHDALSGYGQERGPRSQTEAQAHLNEVKRVATLTSQIEDAGRGQVAGPGSNPPRVAPSKMVADLINVRDALRRENGLDPRTGGLLATVEEQIAKLEARTREIEEQTANGTRPLRRGGQSVEDPAVAAARKALKDALSEQRITDRIAELQRQLGTNDFPEAKTRTPYDGKLARLAMERDALQSQVREAIEAKRPRSLGEKAGALALDIASAPRSLMTSADLSATLRQGLLLAASNPKEAAVAFGRQLRAVVDPAFAHDLHKRLTEGPQARLRESSGLYLTPEEGAGLTTREEGFISRLIGKVPGVSHVAQASERSYRTFMNSIRADVFDGLTEGKGLNDVEMQIISNYVNIASGRGHLPGLEKASQAAANLLFSPRFAASRFEYLLAQPLLGKGTARTRVIIAQEYAKNAAAILSAVGLAKAAGAEVTTDPTSSDFLKIRIGQTRIDLLAGLQQPTVFMAREILGKRTNIAGESSDLANPGFAGPDRLDVALDFVRSKLAPTPGVVADWMKGKDLAGNPFDIGDEAKDLVVPMIYWDTYDALKEHGVAEGTAIGIVASLGAGASTYERKTTDKGPNGRRIGGRRKETPEAARERERHRIIDQMVRDATGGMSREEVNEYRRNSGLPPLEVLR